MAEKKEISGGNTKSTTIKKATTARKPIAQKNVANKADDLKYLNLLDDYNSLKKLFDVVKSENEQLEKEILELKSNKEQLEKEILELKVRAATANYGLNLDNLNASFADKIVKIKTSKGNYLYAAGEKLIIGPKKANSNNYLFKVLYRPRTTNTFIVAFENENFLQPNKDTKQIFITANADKNARIIIGKDENGNFRIYSKELNAFWYVDSNGVKIGDRYDYFIIEEFE
ncbi:hypothetical protein FACS1894132_10220 [Clostridia bacterium]|nr:hypothetical protein FACS1894132_10220 [Clostridia bacterium]